MTVARIIVATTRIVTTRNIRARIATTYAFAVAVVKLAIGHCSLFNLLVRFITGYC